MPWAYVHAYLAVIAALLVGWHAFAGAVDKAVLAAGACAFFTLEATGHDVLGWTRRVLEGRRR
jgi:hypothetical protein